MKISELIRDLSACLCELGDKDVRIHVDGYEGDFSCDTIEEIGEFIFLESYEYFPTEEEN